MNADANVPSTSSNSDHFFEGSLEPSCNTTPRNTSHGLNNLLTEYLAFAPDEFGPEEFRERCNVFQQRLRERNELIQLLKSAETLDARSDIFCGHILKCTERLMNEKKGSDEEKATDEESSEQGTISNLASDIP
uniref:Uncharacterized protein n=1 Tax=Ditylum brightwellii TaxID=49249 RepID=A0A6U3T6Z6_9STRA|mmetsp:Transcript_2472/g.3296  ORF Transcript_2472/g.3296 Transcript_2472/m.3296 type:complete len:134 (+) Transcript_2472:206-607(+)